ncbi:MAG: M48 family metalloprotease [Proteobacteria bacterium]|jgi:predicted Zn-dependent protease|nr:M48 family metalloprotease [Pseudomonadota bacterium]
MRQTQPATHRLLAALCAAFMLCGVASVHAAGSPATSSSKDKISKGEVETSRKYYEEITKFYGIYEDQAVQDYVNAVGQRVARASDMPDVEWRFTVLDDGSINAFTTGGGYVYIFRGLLSYMNSEAELAAVIGHEIAHVTKKHVSKGQGRSILANVAAIGAAILTGNAAVADMASIGAAAWVQGYGREAESEADRVGMVYMTRAGYDPRAMRAMFDVLKAQENFEIAAARAEGREPRVYHGVFSDHPAPDERGAAAARAAALVVEPEKGFVFNRNTYMQAIDGMAFGTSRAQGVVRDNRFYHADMGITMAFPRGWIIENQRDRILAFTRNQESVMQIAVEPKPENKSPREFLIQKLGRGNSLAGGTPVTINDMDGYSVLTRSGSPLDNGAGPVRYIVLYRGGSAFIFAGASRSAREGKPEADGIFRSVAETMRSLKSAEFPLTEPYRLKILRATETTRLAEHAQNIPAEKYHEEELELINGVYPNKPLPVGEYIKVVE